LGDCGSRKGIVAWSFYEVTLIAQKRPPEGYPGTLLTLGGHIRKRRLDLRLLQRELAERINCTEESIYHWENNKNYPKIMHLPKIIEFLGYDPEYKGGNSLAVTLWNYRRKHGLTLKKLGKIIGVDETTILWWERGQALKMLRSKQRLQAFLEHEGMIDVEIPFVYPKAYL